MMLRRISMIADIKVKKITQVITELFIQGRKLNTSLFFTKSYFSVSKQLNTLFYHANIS